MLVRFWWNKYHIEWDSIHRKQTKFIKELFSLQKLPRRKLIEICKMNNWKMRPTYSTKGIIMTIIKEADEVENDKGNLMTGSLFVLNK